MIIPIIPAPTPEIIRDLSRMYCETLLDGRIQFELIHLYKNASRSSRCALVNCMLCYTTSTLRHPLILERRVSIPWAPCAEEARDGVQPSGNTPRDRGSAPKHAGKGGMTNERELFDKIMSKIMSTMC